MNTRADHVPNSALFNRALKLVYQFTETGISFTRKSGNGEKISLWDHDLEMDILKLQFPHLSIHSLQQNITLQRALSAY